MLCYVLFLLVASKIYSFVAVSLFFICYWSHLFGWWVLLDLIYCVLSFCGYFSICTTVWLWWVPLKERTSKSLLLPHRPMVIWSWNPLWLLPWSLRVLSLVGIIFSSVHWWSKEDETSHWSSSWYSKFWICWLASWWLFCDCYLIVWIRRECTHNLLAYC